MTDRFRNVGKIDYNANNTPKSTLVATMLRNRELLDFMITVNQHTFKVHKCVLAAKSTYFREQFEKYPETDKIIMHKLDGAAMQCIVDFIYSGHTVILKRFLKQCVAVGNLFNLKELKNLLPRFAYQESYLIKIPPPTFMVRIPPRFEPELPVVPEKTIGRPILPAPKNVEHATPKQKVHEFIIRPAIPQTSTARPSDVSATELAAAEVSIAEVPGAEVSDAEVLGALPDLSEAELLEAMEIFDVQVVDQFAEGFQFPDDEILTALGILDAPNVDQQISQELVPQTSADEIPANVYSELALLEHELPSTSGICSQPTASSALDVCIYNANRNIEKIEEKNPETASTSSGSHMDSIVQSVENIEKPIRPASYGARIRRDTPIQRKRPQRPTPRQQFLPIKTPTGWGICTESTFISWDTCQDTPQDLSLPKPIAVKRLEYEPYDPSAFPNPSSPEKPVDDSDPIDFCTLLELDSNDEAQYEIDKVDKIKQKLAQEMNVQVEVVLKNREGELVKINNILSELDQDLKLKLKLIDQTGEERGVEIVDETLILKDPPQQKSSEEFKSNFTEFHKRTFKHVSRSEQHESNKYYEMDNDFMDQKLRQLSAERRAALMEGPSTSAQIGSYVDVDDNFRIPMPISDEVLATLRRDSDDEKQGISGWLEGISRKKPDSEDKVD